MTGQDPSLAWLEDQLDRHGADFGAWPDDEAKSAARELVLASPEARGAWEVAKALDTRLVAARDDLDARLHASGSADRVLGGVMGALPARPPARLHVRRLAVGLAAALLLGIGLGATAPTLAVIGDHDALAIEPLLFGPADLDLS